MQTVLEKLQCAVVCLEHGEKGITTAQEFLTQVVDELTVDPLLVHQNIETVARSVLRKASYMIYNGGEDLEMTPQEAVNMAATNELGLQNEDLPVILKKALEILERSCFFAVGMVEGTGFGFYDQSKANDFAVKMAVALQELCEYEGTTEDSPPIQIAVDHFTTADGAFGRGPVCLKRNVYSCLTGDWEERKPPLI